MSYDDSSKDALYSSLRANKKIKSPLKLQIENLKIENELKYFTLFDSILLKVDNIFVNV